jgi:hypothetical protein
VDDNAVLAARLFATGRGRQQSHPQAHLGEGERFLEPENERAATCTIFQKERRGARGSSATPKAWCLRCSSTI